MKESNHKDDVFRTDRFRDARSPGIGRLLAILLIGRLGFGLLAFNNPQAAILPDSVEYLKLSAQSSEGNFLVENRQDLNWPPGYPIYLNVSQQLIGEGIVTVALSHLFLSSATALLIYLTLAIHGHRKAGYFSAFLYGVSLPIAFWSLTVMAETLFAFALALALLLMTKSARDGSVLMASLSGLALGLASLIRPIGIIFVPLWAAAYLFGYRRHLAPGSRAKSAALFLLCGLIPIMAWTTRNLIVRGDFVFSRVSSKTFISFNVASALAELENISRNDAATLISQTGDPEQFARDFIAEHPVHFLGHQFKGVARTLLGVELYVWSNFVGSDRDEGFGILSSSLRGNFDEAIESIQLMWVDPANRVLIPILGFALLHGIILLGLGALAFLKLGNEPAYLRPVLIVAGVSALALIIAPGGAGQGRFRVPAEAFLSILAGIGFSSLRRLMPTSASQQNPEEISD